jgi:hypothetical protein
MQAAQGSHGHALEDIAAVKSATMTVLRLMCAIR